MLKYERGLHLYVCAGFDGLEVVPSAFVLMGNFQSQPATSANVDYSVIKEQFKSLAHIIAQYQRLQVRFLIMPNPPLTWAKQAWSGDTSADETC